MRYRAFISYASADRVIGQRFQREIEHFKIPKALRGVDHGFGPVPKRLTPLFRDRSDADASSSLSETLRSALESSEALIVLCSPVSACSQWVNSEIKTFKMLGRGERVFPVLIDGSPERFDPHSAPTGAFPPALFQRFDSNGAVIAEDVPEPLAADLRDTGDGAHFAKLKVVAAIAGIPLTVLTQRQQEAERRERVIVRRVAGAMATLAILASVAAVLALRAEGRARARLEDAIEIAARRVDDAARFQDQYGVPTEVIRKLLTGAEHDFDELIRAPDTTSPTLELQRGRLLVLFSDLYRTVGDGARELQLAQDGRAAIDKVPVRRAVFSPSTWFVRMPSPEDIEKERLAALEALGLALNNAGMPMEAERVLEEGRQLANASNNRVSTARFWSRLGELRYLDGNLDGALAAHESAIAALGNEAPRDLALARSDRAEMLLELGRLQEALDEQTRAASAFEAEALRAPDDTGSQRSWAQALSRQGDMMYAVSNDWRPSIALFEKALGILERIRSSDPTRIDYARDLSIALERIGDARFQLNELAEAKESFERSLVIRREVLARDPKNEEARRDVAVALERQGDLAMSVGDAKAALAAFDEARNLQEVDEVSNADPVQVRDLAVMWSRTAQARRTSGSGSWKDAHLRAIELMSSLVAKENAAPGWLRDLAIFHTQYGDALEKTGDRAQAARQWETALQLTEKQRGLTPDDPKLKEDAAALQGRIRRVRN
jgi:tetratricopeptide (TPR) repeat protein